WLAHWALDNGVTHLHAGWASYPASAALVASELADVPFSFSGHAHDIFLDSAHLPEKIRRAEFVTTCTATNRTHLSALAPAGRAPGRARGRRYDDGCPHPGRGAPSLRSRAGLRPHGPARVALGHTERDHRGARGGQRRHHDALWLRGGAGQGR